MSNTPDSRTGCNDIARYRQLLGGDAGTNDLAPIRRGLHRAFGDSLEQIASRDRFDMRNYPSLEDIDRCIQETRHKVMYRDQSKID
jgi:hypothetical protein